MAPAAVAVGRISEDDVKLCAKTALAAVAAARAVLAHSFTSSSLILPTATAAGAISGTPKTAGKFTVSVNVSDAAGTSLGNRRIGYTLTIAPAPPGITTASAPNGTAGTAYTASFAASGGTAPYTFSATGLPAGLSLSAAGAI